MALPVDSTDIPMFLSKRTRDEETRSLIVRRNKWKKSYVLPPPPPKFVRK